jgi:hypothetical protein
VFLRTKAALSLLYWEIPVQPGFDAVGYDGLGMHEVVEEPREMQHPTVVEPQHYQHYQQPQPIQEGEEEPRDDAVMNVEEEESSRQIMRSNRTRKQVYYKNNSKKKNSNHGAWKESALVNDAGSNTRKFHRGKKYGHQQHKHREQDTRV